MKRAYYIVVKTQKEKNCLSEAIARHYGNDILNRVYIDINPSDNTSSRNPISLQRLRKDIRLGHIDAVHIRTFENRPLSINESADCVLDLLKNISDPYIGGQFLMLHLAALEADHINWELDENYLNFLEKLISPLLARKFCYVCDIFEYPLVWFAMAREVVSRTPPYFRDASGVFQEPMPETLKRYRDTGFMIYRPEKNQWCFMDPESIASLLFIYKKSNKK